jgi:hypothetical protein
LLIGDLRAFVAAHGLTKDFPIAGDDLGHVQKFWGKQGGVNFFDGNDDREFLNGQVLHFAHKGKLISSSIYPTSPAISHQKMVMHLAHQENMGMGQPVGFSKM